MGVSSTTRIFPRDAISLLGRRGTLVLEIGYGQSRQVRTVVADAGFATIEIRDDLRGIPRVVVARKDEDCRQENP